MSTKLTAILLESDGATTVRTLKASRIEVQADRRRPIRRTCEIELAGTDELADLQVLGRMIRVQDGATDVFWGYIDEISRSDRPGETVIRVSCRDKAKRLALARWTDEKTYEDTTATETANLISNVTASSTLSAGGDITGQARVYDRQLWATVLGIEQKVTPTAESGDPLAGTYSVDYSVAGMTQLKSIVYIDLKATENVQAVNVTTNGTATIEKSSDGKTWGAFAAGTLRYLRVTTTKAAGPITLGVTVLTNSSYPASNARDGDKATSWRPTTADLDRYITADLGSAQTINRIRAELGISATDPEARYKVKVERSTDATTWTEVTTVTSAGAVMDVRLDDASARYVRLTCLARYGPPFAVRDLRVTRVTTDASKKVYLGDIIQDIAATEGEALFSVTPSREYVPAVTFERGTSKWEAIQRLAADHGWEVYYDRTGALVARPVDVDPYKTLPEFHATLDASTTWSDADIWNQVIAENGDPKTPLTTTKTNSDAWSGTSTVNVGTRTSPVLRLPLCDTQAKLDYAALVELLRRSRQTYTARVTHVADGASSAATLEAGDVVSVIHEGGGEPVTMVVEAFRLTDDGESYDVTLEVAAL